MPQIRLVGLLLFISAIVLALAAALTQTTHIRFSNAGLDGQQPRWLPPVEPEPIPTGHDADPPASLPEQPSFTSVPVAWPLLALSAVGLFMWFLHAPTQARGKSRKHSRSHAKRRRR